ncbi:unnamed protein product, partial [Polarella glacialis]
MAGLKLRLIALFVGFIVLGIGLVNLLSVSHRGLSSSPHDAALSPSLKAKLALLSKPAGENASLTSFGTGVKCSPGSCWEVRSRHLRAVFSTSPWLQWQGFAQLDGNTQ